RVMATVVLAEDARFDPVAFVKFLEAQPDISPKWFPTFVRIASDIPQTATNKILKRELRAQGFARARVADPIFARGRGDVAYLPFDAEAEATLVARFEATGRSHLL
ncbi:MAG: acyl-CoA synthetase, partial [bacterium]